MQKESEELRKLQAERQEVQEALERLDEQKLSLEEQLKLLRQQCSQENQLVGVRMRESSNESVHSALTALPDSYTHNSNHKQVFLRSKRQMLESSL